MHSCHALLSRLSVFLFTAPLARSTAAHLQTVLFCSLSSSIHPTRISSSTTVHSHTTTRLRSSHSSLAATSRHLLFHLLWRASAHVHSTTASTLFVLSSAAAGSTPLTTWHSMAAPNFHISSLALTHMSQLLAPMHLKAALF